LRKQEIDASGAGYYQIRVVGDQPLQAGILGDVFHGDRPHVVEEKASDVSKYEFGIKEEDILRLYQAFDEKGKRIAVVEGPTGSGKSTFLPYRLIEAPPGVRTPDIFTRDGQVVVTQPRILPTSGISKFISGSLNGSSVGQGVDIGFKYSGVNETDRRNRLVFVTDGTLINWIKNDQLSHISVIMIDEAHERSKNIDLILMLLRNNFARYPKLKLIIASATINAQDFIAYYGGESKVEHLKFEGMMFDVEEYFAEKKLIDYENLLKKPSSQIDEEISSIVAAKVVNLVDLVKAGDYKTRGDFVAFLHSEKSVDLAVSKVKKLLLEKGISQIEVLPLYRNLSTSQQNKVLEKKANIITTKVVNHWLKWKAGQSEVVIAVLLDEKSVLQTVDALSEAIKHNKSLINNSITTVLKTEEGERPFKEVNGVHKLSVITNYENLAKAKSLYPEAEIIEDWRVIIATNVAETSLTVDGTVHVIDSGLIKQTVFDPGPRTQRLTSRTHSQAGCKQRKGRAGRIRPGYAHYLYTREQFDKFEEYTKPDVERSSLEDLVLQAKSAGIGDLQAFDWFKPTENILNEISNAQEALKVRGALDSDGEITDLGLEILNMTLDPLVSSCLMRADQFCCAMEAATILSFVKLNAPIQTSLFNWNRNWDSQTRWEIRQRQKPLIQNCQDDFDLIIRTVAAWQMAGESSSQRASWAKQMYVNHQFIQNQLLPQRETLLELLSAGLRGKANRALDPSLLDRVRFAMMLAAGDQISTAGKELISYDSCCWHKCPEKYLFLIKKPIKVTNSERRHYQVSLISKVSDEWLDHDYKTSLFTTYIPQIKFLSKREPDGLLKREESAIWPYAAQYPPGTEVLGRISQDDAQLVVGNVATPAPQISEVAGWGRVLDVITDYQIEEEIGVDEINENEPVLRESTTELSVDEQEEGTFQAPLLDSVVTILFSEIPGAIGGVDVTTDKGWTFESIKPKDGNKIQLMLPPGPHKLHIKPLFELESKTDYQANLWIQIEEEKDYLVIMGKWRGKYPAGNFVLEDVQPEKRRKQSSVRWIPLGWKNAPIAVKISGRQRPMKGFYPYKTGEQLTFEIFSKGADLEEESALGRFEFVPEDQKQYTLLVHNQFEKSSKPAFDLLEGELSPKVGEQRRSPVPIQYTLQNSITETEVTDDILHLIIEECKPVDMKIEMGLSVKQNEDKFDKFVQCFKVGDRIEVEPVDVDLYPNGNESALIVREPQSGLFIAVRAIDLFFESSYSGLLLERFLAQGKVEIDVEWVDESQKRVGLTRLGMIANSLLPSDETRIVQAEILKVETILHPSGLVVRLDLDNGIFFPAFIWEQALMHGTSKDLEKFNPGEEIEVTLKFTEGKVRSSKLIDAQLDKFSSKLNSVQMKKVDAVNEIRVYKPITAQEYVELADLDDQSDFQWVARELYRRSNQPRVDIHDSKHIDEICRRHPIGSEIVGAVSKVYDKKVEIEMEQGVYGTITIGEWSNYFISSLESVCKVGETVKAEVLSVKENGQFSLSRKKVALNRIQVNMVCVGKISEIVGNGLTVQLEQNAKTGEKLQSLSARIPKNMAIFAFMPNYKDVNLSSTFNCGQELVVRITRIIKEENKVSIEATLTQVYQTVLKIPSSSSSRIGLLIGRNGQNIIRIQNSTLCSINNQTQGDGSIFLLLSSDDELNIDKCQEEIKRVIPDLLYVGPYQAIS
jgi:hypothetical protein